MEAPIWPCLNLETKEGGADRVLGWENTKEYRDCRLNCEIKKQILEEAIGKPFPYCCSENNIKVNLDSKDLF